MPETKPCQCEHIAHFDHEARTPNGNPGHKYGVRFFGTQLVKTTYGSFEVCRDCAEDCHA